MIIDKIIEIMWLPLRLLLGALPTITFDIPPDIANSITELTAGVAYLFPVKTAITIIGLKVAMRGLHLAWAIVLRVKSFIPTYGN